MKLQENAMMDSYKTANIVWIIICMTVLHACSPGNKMRSSNQAVNWNNSIIAGIEGNRYTFKKKPDDHYWMTANLNLNIAGSYCYNNDSANCKEYYGEGNHSRDKTHTKSCKA